MGNYPNVTGDVVEKNVNVVDVEEKKQFLSELEICKLEIHEKNIKLLEKETEITTLKVHIIEAQKMALNYKNQDDNTNLNNASQEINKYLKELSKDYKIPENIKWSYNKETGEIITNCNKLL